MLCPNCLSRLCFNISIYSRALTAPTGSSVSNVVSWPVPLLSSFLNLPFFSSCSLRMLLIGKGSGRGRLTILRTAANLFLSFMLIWAKCTKVEGWVTSGRVFLNYSGRRLSRLSLRSVLMMSSLWVLGTFMYFSRLWQETVRDYFLLGSTCTTPSSLRLKLCAKETTFLQVVSLLTTQTRLVSPDRVFQILTADQSIHSSPQKFNSLQTKSIESTRVAYLQNFGGCSIFSWACLLSDPYFRSLFSQAGLSLSKFPSGKLRVKKVCCVARLMFSKGVLLIFF